MAKAQVDTRVNGNRMAFDAATMPRFEPFLTAGTKVFEAWTAIGNELIEFGRTRLDQGIEMSKAMAQSSSLNEAMELQARFARSMMNDFLGEASKLADMSTRPVIEGFTAMHKTSHSNTTGAGAAE
jgi:hypothetical protein